MAIIGNRINECRVGLKVNFPINTKNTHTRSPVIKNKSIDPLEKINIQNIIDEYNPDSIVAYSHAVHLEFFPGMNSKYNAEYFDVYPYYTIYSKKVENKKQRALILCVSGELCDSVASKPVTTILKRYYESGDKYKLIFNYEKKSKVLNGFGSKAGSGTNGLYISVWDMYE